MGMWDYQNQRVLEQEETARRDYDRAFDQYSESNAKLDRSRFAVSTGSIALIFAILQWADVPLLPFQIAMVLWLLSIVALFVAMELSVRGHAISVIAREAALHFPFKIPPEAYPHIEQASERVNKANTWSRWIFYTALAYFAALLFITAPFNKKDHPKPIPKETTQMSKQTPKKPGPTTKGDPIQMPKRPAPKPKPAPTKPPTK